MASISVRMFGAFLPRTTVSASHDGPADSTIDLDEGKYKAKSKPARGYEADTSDVVKLKK